MSATDVKASSIVYLLRMLGGILIGLSHREWFFIKRRFKMKFVPHFVAGKATWLTRLRCPYGRAGRLRARLFFFLRSSGNHRKLRQSLEARGRMRGPCGQLDCASTLSGESVNGKRRFIDVGFGERSRDGASLAIRRYKCWLRTGEQGQTVLKPALIGTLTHTWRALTQAEDVSSLAA